MTLDEVIERYTRNAEYERTHGSLQGCMDFRQLAEWLKELKQLREQQFCENAISRILERMWNCRGKYTTSIDKVKMEQIIRDELLPVTPQPKIGHWVLGICDNCGYDWSKDAPIASVPNYCPNCGAKMVEQ